uniref:Nucleotide-diphospho-sugar transferase domain-containing protein n=1 Tax=Lotharella globosa TaxID=91324 RepID=A0A7S3Z9C6_9EUKA|mmetsp:Transcript_16219/g.32854  ORF Transcript_16219/g.32854 Transcript_16219/m.32854 type:complete len:363 (+) Transcript_16219:137-1225(+)|eukprot:CAMPEP_0167771796 /NCGR_PEP_ID=MMETSP0111_2-20121227/482_1 /TAXON_ID=91324 /ORGANISM="Lotharella globosa, Strain CCCM811" /LENGTH=362 /DNA_ID=CAMNT_0007661199 /DNA_START=121 /DNA_END=1209 /DNA_ORIENTATION=-
MNTRFLWRCVAFLFAVSWVLLDKEVASFDTVPGKWSDYAKADDSQLAELVRGENFDLSTANETGSAKNKSVAVLLTGEIRYGKSQEWVDMMRNFDVYISTYKDYRTNALLVTDEDKVLLWSRESVKCDKHVINQWWHLDQILVKFRSSLEKYDVIVKLRSDLLFHEPLTHAHFANASAGHFQLSSDHSFYAESSTFLYVMGSFYSSIINEYFNQDNAYFPINWSNMKASCVVALRKYPPIDKTKYRIIRVDIYATLGSLVYPASVFKGVKGLHCPLDYEPPFTPFSKERTQNLEKLVSNILAVKGTPNITQGKANPAWGGARFSSEKYFFLHIVNRAIIRPSYVPSFGIRAGRREGSTEDTD